MGVERPRSIQVDVLNSTTGVEGARTYQTGARVYAPKSNRSGAGVPDARRATKGISTTVVSDAAAGAAFGAVALGAFTLLNGSSGTTK